jgi:hypothetical protein
MKKKITRVDKTGQEIRQYLEAEKLRIYQEIRQYPPPIPACDVQFNGLLAERATILQEISRVDTILKQELSEEERVGLLDQFMQTSHYGNEDELANIRHSLKRLMAER